MNLVYAVKQLDLEIRSDEDRLRDKKVTRGKLFSVLSQQEKLLLESETPPPEPKKG